MILKASEEKMVEKLGAELVYLPNIAILQTIRRELNSVQRLPSRYQCILQSSTLVTLYIESNNENIRLLKIGIPGMFDDLNHDKVVVSSPRFSRWVA